MSTGHGTAAVAQFLTAAVWSWYFSTKNNIFVAASSKAVDVAAL